MVEHFSVCAENFGKMTHTLGGAPHDERRIRMANLVGYTNGPARHGKTKASTVIQRR
jgi:hypothetical protein